MTASSNDYRLPRDSAESARLNSQHNIHKSSLGYLLHPVITTSLQSSSTTTPSTSETIHIADLGTGTGVFLQDLLSTLPSSLTQPTRLHLTGFDISSEQFPSSSSLPANITLLEQDTLQPFPASHQGKYNAVHARLIGQAFPTEKWTFVVGNILSIVKPGGFVQWVEPDHTMEADLVFLHSSSDSNSTMGSEQKQPDTKAWRKAIDLSKRRAKDLQWERETSFAYALASLLRDSEKPRTDAVREEVVPIDFAPEVREESMRNSLKMFRDGLSDFVESGMEDEESGVRSREDVEGLLGEMEREMGQWKGRVSYRYFLKVVVARRAM